MVDVVVVDVLGRLPAPSQRALGGPRVGGPQEGDQGGGGPVGRARAGRVADHAGRLASGRLEHPGQVLV